MKAHRSVIDFLVLAGIAALVVLMLPVFAVGAFLLRAVFFFVIPLAVVGGLTLWFTSDRFRTWIRTTGAMNYYKGLRLAPDVALDRGHAWTRARGTNATIGADDLLATTLGPLDAELRSALLGRLGRLQQELALTVIHVTHDPAEARTIATREVRLRAGRLEDAA